MVPQAENGFELTKQLQPFARDKDPLYSCSFGYNSYTVHNGTEDWTQKYICHISRPNIFPFKKTNKQKKPPTHRMGKDAPHTKFITGGGQNQACFKKHFGEQAEES